MKKVLFLILFQSATAFANLSGTWIGTGKLLNFDGRTYDCQAVHIGLELTPTTLHINQFLYFCGEWEFSWEQVATTIKDGQVFYNGVNVGTVDDNQIQLSFVDTANNLRANVSVQKNGSVVKLKDELSSLDGSQVYTRMNAEMGHK